MKINEIFPSIQGEGVHAGRKMTFIRLSGCNLACAWCDTKYASKVNDELSAKDINPDTDWICITGGEPLFQADSVAALVLHLRSRGKHTEIETNGSIPPPRWAFMCVDGFPLVDSWVVDVKLPSTGNPSSLNNISEWANNMRTSDQIKLVVADEEDLGVAQEWITHIRGKAGVLVSPVILEEPDRDWMCRVADFCVKFNLRYSLQIHKILWGNKRGV